MDHIFRGERHTRGRDYSWKPSFFLNPIHHFLVWNCKGCYLKMCFSCTLTKRSPPQFQQHTPNFPVSFISTISSEAYYTWCLWVRNVTFCIGSVSIQVAKRHNPQQDHCEGDKRVLSSRFFASHHTITLSKHRDTSGSHCRRCQQGGLSRSDSFPHTSRHKRPYILFHSVSFWCQTESHAISDVHDWALFAFRWSRIQSCSRLCLHAPPVQTSSSLNLSRSRFVSFSDPTMCLNTTRCLNVDVGFVRANSTFTSTTGHLILLTGVNRWPWALFCILCFLLSLILK